MTHVIRSLAIGVTVPLLGGVLVLPSFAQTAAPTVTQVPEIPLSTASSPMQDKLPGDIPLKWPPPSEQSIELVLQLSERQLYVYRGETLATTFPVAIGRSGWETPTGTFEVSYMLENPGWTNPFTGAMMPPGPENPLGERWIAFWTDGHNEIGFHGTPNHDSIGQAASHGCVRLHNEHIRELYDMVTPGTLVTVLP